MPTLSIIIVNYNTREHLKRTLQTVGREHEVIVVDNASRDGSVEMVELEFPHVKLIKNPKNRGFGAANNQGIDAAQGELVLFLNSDCRPRGDSIRRLVEAFGEAPDCIACGPRLVFPDGKTQASCANRLTIWAVFCEQTGLEKLFPWAKPLSPYWETNRLMNRPENVFEVEQVMGACLLMKPVLKFDEDYFLYVEDTDLCRRLSDVGSIYYIKDAVFEHHLGSSSKFSPWEAIARYNRGKELYFEKHYSKGAGKVCRFLNKIGATLRFAMYFIPAVLTLGLVPSLREKSSLWSKVWGSPKSGPPLPRDSR